MESPIFVTYAALGIMAIVPIYIGSFMSLHESKKTDSSDKVSKSDAYWFPVIGSCVLFGFYLLFTYFSKEYINYLLTAYFSLFGAVSVASLLNSFIVSLLPTSIAMAGAHTLRMAKTTASKGKADDEVFNIDLTWTGALSYILSIAFTAYYVYSKHWIASNLFGLAFSITAISMLHLDSFATGMILLSGLFIYDVFWVFGTGVMVKVAKSFDVPVKVLFPKDIFAVFAGATPAPTDFAMLGLGDIVIPGAFVSLCLRFDEYLAMAVKAVSKKGKGSSKSNLASASPSSYSKPYFYTCYLAYIAGLATTVAVMHNFKAAQPALLYLSPACILAALGVALCKGQMKQLFAYTTEEPAKDEAAPKTAAGSAANDSGADDDRARSGNKSPSPKKPAANGSPASAKKPIGDASAGNQSPASKRASTGRASRKSTKDQ